MANWVACYSIYNENKFIEMSIRNVVEHMDRIIIVEGCWNNGSSITKSLRSTDGTIDTIERLKKEFPKIELYFENRDKEQRQRDSYLEKLDNNDMVLWMDGDEAVLKKELKDAKEYAEYMINKLGHQMLFSHYINVYDGFALTDDHIRGLFFKFRSDLRYLDDERVKQRPAEVYLFENYGRGALYNKSMPVIPWEIIKVFHFKYCKDLDKLVERKLMYDKIWYGLPEDKIEERRKEMMEAGKTNFVPNSERLYTGDFPL